MRRRPCFKHAFPFEGQALSVSALHSHPSASSSQTLPPRRHLLGRRQHVCHLAHCRASKQRSVVQLLRAAHLPSRLSAATTAAPHPRRGRVHPCLVRQARPGGGATRQLVWEAVLAVSWRRQQSTAPTAALRRTTVPPAATTMPQQARCLHLWRQARLRARCTAVCATSESLCGRASGGRRLCRPSCVQCRGRPPSQLVR